MEVNDGFGGVKRGENPGERKDILKSWLQKECERENEREAERNEERASKAKQAESGEGSVADGALGHSVVCRVFHTRKTEQNRTGTGGTAGAVYSTQC